MKKYKNIQLYEDGFNEEYFRNRLAESKAREARWIQKSAEYEAKHPILMHWLYTFSIFPPVLLIGYMLWRCVG